MQEIFAAIVIYLCRKRGILRCAICAALFAHKLNEYDVAAYLANFGIGNDYFLGAFEYAEKAACAGNDYGAYNAGAVIKLQIAYTAESRPVADVYDFLSPKLGKRCAAHIDTS